MQLIAKEIYNTFRNYKADIFFVAALTIVSVVLLDFYNIDMVNNKGKRHINVITIEGYKNKKEDLKRKNELMKKAAEDDKMKKLKLKKKIVSRRKKKLPEKEGFISSSMVVNSSPVLREGMSDEPPAGTPAAEIYHKTKNGPTALKLGKELRSASKNINKQWKDAFCRNNDVENLNKECLKLSSTESPGFCNSTDCCVSVHFSDKSKTRCLAGDKVGPIQTTYLEKAGEDTIEFRFNRDKDYYFHKGKCYGSNCP